MRTDFVAELETLVRDTLRAPEDVEVWRWAEKNIWLTRKESEVAGMFRTDLTPYIRKILECYRTKGVKRVVVMSGTQVVKTIVLLVGGGWFVAHKEGRIIWVMDTERNAKDLSVTRWKPLLEKSPGLRQHVPSNRDQFNNLEQDLGAVNLNFVGSNSPGNLASKGGDLIHLDETDKYPLATEEEGDAITQVRQRGKARSDSLEVAVSSPTTEEGLIFREFQTGTMEEFYVRCPHCHGDFVLETGNEDCVTGKLWWDPACRNEDGSWDYERVKASARYECPHCKALLDDGEKIGMVAAGEWRAMNPNAVPGVVSFHLASHNSPWSSTRLGELAVVFLEAKKKFDLASWDRYYRGWPVLKKASKADGNKLMSRRENWEGVPAGVKGFTVSIDTQDDRLELLAVGWGDGLESWSARHEVIWGDPGRAPVWSELESMLLSLAKLYRVWAVALDTGGHHTDAAYLFVQRMQTKMRIFAVKGANREKSPIISRPSRPNRYGVRLWMVGTDTAKERLFSMFQVAEAGGGYCHFHASLDDEFFLQLAGEECRLVWKAGRAVRRWVKVRDRNEGLDLMVYALAALHISGLKNLGAGRVKLEQGELGLEESVAPAPAAVPPAPAAKPVEDKFLRARRRGGWASRF